MSNFSEFVVEQLAPLREISSRRFFGGTGLSFAGTQFGFVMGSTLYFVVDDHTRAKYQAMGSKCFQYETKKKRVDVRKYYEVPPDALEDIEQLMALARESIRVAEAFKSTAKRKTAVPKVTKPASGTRIRKKSQRR